MAVSDVASGGSTRDLGTLRVDHDFTDKDHVYVVYNAQAFSGGNSAVRTPFTGLGLLSRTAEIIPSPVPTCAIRNNLINEARGGFNREFIYQHSITTLQSFLSSIGLDSAPSMPLGQWSGQGCFPPTDSRRLLMRTFQGHIPPAKKHRTSVEPVSSHFWRYAHLGDKNHNLKMGADFVRNQGLDGFTQGRGAPRGTMTYANPTACANAAACAGAATDPFAFSARVAAH